MDATEIRRLNANYLADKRYGRQELSGKLGYQDNNYLNQLLGGHSPMGGRTARKFESSLGLPEGWMDTPHPDLWGRDDMEVAMYTERLLGSLSSADLSRLIDSALKIIRERKE